MVETITNSSISSTHNSGLTDVSSLHYLVRSMSGADAFVRKLGQLCLEPFHILRKQSAYKNENTSKKLTARDYGYKILTILCLQRVVKAGRANVRRRGSPWGAISRQYRQAIQPRVRLFDGSPQHT